MFHGSLGESIKNEIKVPINIQPDTFRVFLQLLYGQSFEDITNPIVCKPDEYLSFLINLLKVTDFYNAESLKNKVEDIIIRSNYISVCNLCKILKCSEECDAQQLRNYYEKHIKSNKEVVKEQLLELSENTGNYEE